MKKLRIISLAIAFHCVLLILSGCGYGSTATSSYGGSATTTSSFSSGPLSKQQVNELETFLNDRSNNGFVGSLLEYERPQDIDLYFVLYDGGGISRNYDELNPDEKQAIHDAPDYSEYSPIFIFKKSDIEVYLQKKAGISLNNVSKGTQGFGYIEKYDLYYLSHNDTNYIHINITEAEINQNGKYVITYSISSIQGSFIVTLNKIDNEYQFVSNVKL